MKTQHALFLLAILTVCSGFFGFVTPVQAALVDIQVCDDSLYDGGDGSELDPWQISTATQLYNVTFCSDSNNQGNHFKLINNIVIGENFENMYSGDDDNGWMPIGAYFDEGYYSGTFFGTFDGNHNVISDLHINRLAEYQGLFTGIAEGSLIYDLGLERVNIEGYDPGAIAAYLDGTIRTSYVKDSVVTALDADNAGGMVSHINSTGLIEDSYVYDVSVYNQGGISSLGSIAGFTNGGAQMVRVYAEGSLVLTDSTDLSSIGGITAGWYDADVLSDSFAVVDISYDGDEPYIGGLVGKWGEPSEEGNNYWYDPETEDGEEGCIGSDLAYVGGFCTATSSTNQFKNADNEPLASWDIANTDDEEYEEYNGGFPFLAWERDGDDAETVWSVFGYVAPVVEEVVVEDDTPRRSGRSRRSSSGSSSSSRSDVVTDASATESGNTSSSVSDSGTTSMQVRDLTVGMTGDDVLALQRLLNTLGFKLAETGVGSPGNETMMFGSLTRAALAKYQAANNIVPAIGYFGPLTRAQMKGAGVAGIWW